MLGDDGGVFSKTPSGQSGVDTTATLEHFDQTQQDVRIFTPANSFLQESSSFVSSDLPVDLVWRLQNTTQVNCCFLSLSFPFPDVGVNVHPLLDTQFLEES